MTIILFLVDTSASMCQRAYVNGVQKSYLDIAKGAVETFLKYRQRSQDCMGDRYMLLTFEDPPANVKAGWKENHGTFMNELKNLQSNGLTSMGEALRNAFDLLNLNRMQSGIDTYGQGRCPFYLEPSVIIVITDGGKYSFKNGVHQEIILPLNTQTTGAKLTKEPFRWDQRLFSLVLRMSGNRVDDRLEGKVPHDDSPIEKMCEVTGGRSYRVRSHHVLNQCIESLVQKVQPGVVVHFEPLLAKDLKDGEIQDIAFGTTKKMIYVQKHPTQKTFPVGFWPIPEPYWPDSKAVVLPPRDAHPRIRIVTPCVEEPALVRNFPVDKYEVEPSPLTLQILSKREMTRCWPVFVANGIHGLDLPFGYLKANQNFTQVHLVILPYNYITLLPLLADLFQKFGLNPPSEWVYKFSNYVRSIPQYYGPFLRRALASASVPYQLLQYILPENLDSYLSPTVANYLKTMKNNAKQEQESMCMRVFKQLKLPKPAFHQVEVAKLNTGSPWKRDLVSHPQLKETFAKMHSEITQFDQYTIVVPSILQQTSAKNYRNPFEVPRRDLIDEISRMRKNFMKLPTHNVTIFTKDAGHSLPISEMGNYQEYLKNKQSPLRELEPTNVRQHMFGNPYKKDKHMVMVDEADVSEVAPMKMAPGGTPATPGKKEASSRARKRKAGPIHRDYVFKRKYSDSETESGSSSGSSYCGSPSSSIDDRDDDENATQSSNAESLASASDEEEHDLVIDFIDDPMDFENDHVQDFINGEDSEEFLLPSEPKEPPPTPPVLVTNTSAAPPNFSIPQAPDQPPPALSILFSPAPIPIGPPVHSPNIIPIASSLAITGISIPHQISNPNVSVVTASSIVQSSIISATNGTAAAAASSSSSSLSSSLASSSHVVTNGPPANDYAAQEISKILQQCTNGMDQSRHHHHFHQKSPSPHHHLSDDLLDEDDALHINNAHHTNNNHKNNHNSSSSSNHNHHNNLSQNDPTKSKVTSSKRSSTTSTSRQNNNNDDSNHSSSESVASSSHSSSSTTASATNVTRSSSEHDHHNQLQHHSRLQIAANEDEDQKENVRLSNREARGVIFKDIRRPGRDYSLLLDHLNLVRGCTETRLQFVKMCIGESMRFRRKKMAETIQDWWDRQLIGHKNNNNNRT